MRRRCLLFVVAGDSLLLCGGGMYVYMMDADWVSVLLWSCSLREDLVFKEFMIGPKRCKKKKKCIIQQQVRAAKRGCSVDAFFSICLLPSANCCRRAAGGFCCASILANLGSKFNHRFMLNCTTWKHLYAKLISSEMWDCLDWTFYKENWEFECCFWKSSKCLSVVSPACCHEWVSESVSQSVISQSIDSFILLRYSRWAIIETLR